MDRTKKDKKNLRRREPFGTDRCLRNRLEINDKVGGFER